MILSLLIFKELCSRRVRLPDDAIPVVSAQWSSRDDAFFRVAQGIRRVAEKWRAEKTTASAKVADTPPTVDVPPPFALAGERSRSQSMIPDRA